MNIRRIWWMLTHKPKRDVWTETMIALYERQMAARAAMGSRYLNPVLRRR